MKVGSRIDERIAESQPNTEPFVEKAEPVGGEHAGKVGPPKKGRRVRAKAYTQAKIPEAGQRRRRNDRQGFGSSIELRPIAYGSEPEIDESFQAMPCHAPTSRNTIQRFRTVVRSPARLPPSGL